MFLLEILRSNHFIEWMRDCRGIIYSFIERSRISVEVGSV